MGLFDATAETMLLVVLGQQAIARAFGEAVRKGMARHRPSAAERA